jgi:hypothetical protein
VGTRAKKPGTPTELFAGARQLNIESPMGFAQFLTSDSPMLSMPFIGDEGALHCFPVSPNRLFIASKDKKRFAWLAGLPPRRLVSTANLLIVLFATEYVYGTSRHDEDVILEHLGGAFRYSREKFAEILQGARAGQVQIGIEPPQP